MERQTLSREYVDELRTAASALTAVDRPMGSILSRSVELMSSVLADGISAQDLVYTMDSLSSDLGIAMRHDKNKDDLLRRVVYGVTNMLGVMVTKLADKSNEQQQEPQVDEKMEQEHPIDTQERAPVENDTIDAEFAPEALSNDYDDLELLVKDEPLDLFVADALDDKAEPLQPVQQLPLIPVLQQEQANQEQPVTPKPVKNGAKRAASAAKSTENEEERSDGELEMSSRPIRNRKRARYEKEDSDCEKENRNKANIAKKPHVCSVCSHRFFSRARLLSHMGLHSGKFLTQFRNRPHACSYCDSTFTRSDFLHTHLRQQHNVLPFICGTCGERFNMYRELKAHRDRSGHPIGTQSDTTPRRSASKNDEN